MGQMYYKDSSGNLVPLGSTTTSPIQEGLNPSTGANGTFFYDTDAASPSTPMMLLSSTTDNAIARFDGTGGLIQNSGVTIDDTNRLTLPGTAAGYIIVGNAGSGNASAIEFHTGNGSTTASRRWWIGKGQAAESGSNAGSDFFISSYDDSGNSIGNHVTITRSSGLVATNLMGVNWSGTTNAKLNCRSTVSADGAIYSKHEASTGNINWTHSSHASWTGNLVTITADRANTTAYFFLVAYSGYSSTPDIEFLMRGDGSAFADGTWNGGGADYAEFFEWADGNPNNEDRRGISVALEDSKIRPAVDGDAIIGVVSGNPSVVGDTAWNKWTGKYLRDDFGSYVMEDYDVLQWTDDDGNEQAVDADGPDAATAPSDAVVVTQQRRTLNPNFDPDLEYVSREDRPEWACVGLMGKLRLRKEQPVDARWVKMRDVSASVEEWLVR